MGDINQLRNELLEAKRELLAGPLMQQLREAQALINEGLKLQLKTAANIDSAIARLDMRAIDETDAEGGGVTGRRKRSTNLDAPSGEDVPVKAPKKERAVRELSGELVEPGSGKRGCSNCKRTGHRAKNCPNPPYEG